MVKALKEVGYLEEVVGEDDATGRRIPEHSMLSDDAMELFVKGNMSLRKFMVEEICPAMGIKPERLREGASPVTVIGTMMVVVSWRSLTLTLTVSAGAGVGRC